MSEENLKPISAPTPETPVAEAHEPAMEPVHDGFQPAGFWVRAGAASIDGLVVFAVLFVIAFGAILVRGADNPPTGLIRFAALLVSGTYYTVLTGLAGQTLGKMAAGIQVQTMDHGHVSYQRALGRWAGYFLSSLTLGIGYMMAGFTEGKRALHDRVSKTQVVFVPGVTPLRRRVMAGLGIFSVVGFFLAATLAAIGARQMGVGGLQQEWIAESAAIANLQAVRTLVDQYKAKFGDVPAALDDLKKLDGFTSLPELAVGGHAPASGVEAYASLSHAVDGKQQLDAAQLKDTGKWGYVAGTDANRGHVFIDCTHTDSQGKAWFQY